MGADWSRIRREFPALDHWTFLNTATFGQLPRRSVQAVMRHFAHRDETACTDFLEWFSAADRIRQNAATLLHCAPDDIAFVPNAATALATLMNGMDWHSGDRVVTLAGEFPNNLYAPAVLAGLGVEFVETPWESFYDAVTAHTRLVLLSTVNYTNGFRPPLEEISPFLRERGVLLYVDGTQSVGALPFDTAAIQPAVLGVDAYKWLLGPTGSGLLYVRPDVRRRLRPSVIGWRSHKDWRRVANLHHGTPEFASAAEKYEGGMLNFPSLFGLGASLEMMLEIGPAAIETRVKELAARTRDLLRELGARLLCDEAPHYDAPVIAARFPGRDAAELARGLRERRVLVSARHGNLRVSAHFYNNEEDLERLGAELQRLR